MVVLPRGLWFCRGFLGSALCACVCVCVFFFFLLVVFAVVVVGGGFNGFWWLAWRWRCGC